MSTVSSIKPALDQLAELARGDIPLGCEPVSPTRSLLTRLSQVPDRRKRRGRRHELVVVLALAACAMLVVGNDSVAAIWQWSAGTAQGVLARLGARRDGLTGRYLVPSERTFRRVLADLDSEALDLATCGFATDVTRGLGPVPVVASSPGPLEREQRRTRQRQDQRRVPSGVLPGAAVDGKALRGSVRATGDRTFLVGAISHGSGVVLGQRQVPDKKGEGGQVEALLAPLDVAGMVFTLDALHIRRRPPA